MTYHYSWDDPHPYDGSGGDAPCGYGWEPPDAGMCRKGEYDPVHGKTSWDAIIDCVKIAYPDRILGELTRPHTVTSILLAQIRHEEKRRDPYDRLMCWVKTLPDWRDGVCRCFECH